MNNSDIPSKDVEILRSLAERIAEIAHLPAQKTTAENWRDLNDLQSRRPMVAIFEMPWHELDVEGNLELQCSDSWARDQECQLRRNLYQWENMPGDMVVSDFLSCPLAITNTGFGIEEDVDISRTDDESVIYSRHFHRQIVEPKDIEKIKMPVVTHDEKKTEVEYQKMCYVYDGIMPVRKEGIKHIWYTPWDCLVSWWGVQEALMDLVLRPEMVNDAVAKCAESMNCGLDQMEKLGLLSLGADNIKIGSGGYGYTSELPGNDFDASRVKPMDNWGCSNAQIFSEVSPEMHWEFALRHDIPWLERWGLNYYGCCEPLHDKIDILRNIPRLRKISMSPWVKLDKAIEAVGDGFVFSYKPNPAIFAGDQWRPEEARKILRKVLEKTRGCHLEIIMKDISTVRYKPQRLWEWSRIATELAQEYAIN